MLKFSTFTGAHNNRETEGRKEIDGAISAQPDSAVVGEQLIVLSERRRVEKRGDESYITQISREKE